MNLFTGKLYQKDIYCCVNDVGEGFCFDTKMLSLYKIKEKDKEKAIEIVADNRKFNDRLPKMVYQETNRMCDTLTFVLTHNCNMRCSYCYYGNHFDNQYEEISSEKILMYYEKYDNYFMDGIKAVHFFGGEPLLAFHKIKEAVELIEEYCIKNNRKKPSFSLNTNALLFNREIIEYFYEHKVNITVSLDGKKENNIYRIKKDGMQTFDSVVTKVELIKKLHPDYVINVEATYTTRNVLDFYKTGKHDIEVLREIGFTSVHLVPAILEEDDELNALGAKSDEKQTFGYIKYAYDYMFQSFHTEHPIVIDDYTALVNILKQRKIRNADCHAGIKKFAVNTDGSCYSCHVFVDDNNYAINENALKNSQYFFSYVTNNINKYNRDNMCDCKNCWCKNICIQCRYVKHTTGFCNYRKFTNEYLLNYIANGR